MQIILGSRSPRRKEILDLFSLPHSQLSPPFDEESVPYTGSPEEYVQAIARGKSESLCKKNSEALIITADTLVFQDGKAFGKPQDHRSACAMLGELSGRWHSVFTAVTVRLGLHVEQGVERTDVLFNSLSKEQIETYLSLIEWRDKAGSYAIQERGGLIVKKIEGCIYNVIGLPINTLQGLLLSFSIDLWESLKLHRKDGIY